MKDITGQRFGMLVAIEPTKKRQRVSRFVMWLCRCDCGKTKIISSRHLISGMTRSCGHLHIEITKARWGEKSSAHKLTAEQVNDIRHRYAAGFVTQKELGEEFQISPSQISRIARGETWRNLLGGPVTRMSPVTRAPKIRQRWRIKQRNEGVSMSKR